MDQGNTRALSPHVSSFLFFFSVFVDSLVQYTLIKPCKKQTSQGIQCHPRSLLQAGKAIVCLDSIDWSERVQGEWLYCDKKVCLSRYPPLQTSYSKPLANKSIKKLSKAYSTQRTLVVNDINDHIKITLRVYLASLPYFWIHLKRHQVKSNIILRTPGHTT